MKAIFTTHFTTFDCQNMRIYKKLCENHKINEAHKTL